jgi:ArsR family transcriptional regulator
VQYALDLFCDARKKTLDRTRKARYTVYRYYAIWRKEGETVEPTELVRIFKALANENRLKLFEAIKESQAHCACCPENSELFKDSEKGTICCVDEIAGQFDIAQSTISQHLKELYNAGLLERHKRAQWVYYTVNHDKLDQVGEYLREFSSAITEQS